MSKFSLGIDNHENMHHVNIFIKDKSISFSRRPT